MPVMSAPDWDRKASLPGGRPAQPEIRVQTDSRHGNAETVGSDDAQATGPRRIERGLLDLG
jgi:hypothetical protein